MRRLERGLVITALSIATVFGIRLGDTATGGAEPTVSIRSGSARARSSSTGYVHTTRSHRSHVGGGLHGGK